MSRPFNPNGVRATTGGGIAAGEIDRPVRDGGTPHHLTLSQIGALFLSRNAGTLDPKTLRRYGQIIANLVNFFGEERPDQLHIGRLEQYRDHRLAAHWTPRLGTVPRRQISPRTVWGELTFAVKLLGFGFDRAIETGMASLPVRKAPDVADRCRTRGRALSIEEFWRPMMLPGRSRGRQIVTSACWRSV